MLYKQEIMNSVTDNFNEIRTLKEENNIIRTRITRVNDDIERIEENMEEINKKFNMLLRYLGLEMEKEKYVIKEKE